MSRREGVGNGGHMKRNSPSTKRYRGPKPSKFVTQREVRGGKIELGSNPPEVAYQPWMPLIVVHSGMSGDIAITVRDLVKQICRQVDPTHHAIHAFPEKWDATEPILQIRVRSVRAWNLTGRMISLSVDDFSSPDKAISDIDTLCGIVDTGSTQHVPAVGYQLPLSCQNIVLRNDSHTGAAILYHVMCADTDTSIIYTSVFYRFDGPAKITGFQDSMINLVRSISTDVQNIRQSQKRVEQSTRKIANHSKGGIGEAIVDGVKVIAPYVIPTVVGDPGLHAKVDQLSDLMRTQVLDDVSVVSMTEIKEIVEEIEERH